MRENKAKNVCRRCGRIPALYAAAAVFGLLVLCAGTVHAALTDTPTAWTNFWGADGFVKPYTFEGSIIRDHETSQDPSNGGTGVQPANIDLASGAADLGPGPEAVAWFGYYDGGTAWDPLTPSTMDDDYILFRIRIDKDPALKEGFKSYHWNVLIDTDNDGFKEFWIDTEGNSDTTWILYEDINAQLMGDRGTDPNFTPLMIDRFIANSDPLHASYSPNSHTRTVDIGDGTAEFFIDVQLPMTSLDDELGNQVIWPDSPIRFVYSTGASNQDALQKDWMMDLEYTGPGDPITPGDPVTPGGEAVIYFTDTGITDDVEFYNIGDNIYVVVNHEGANSDSNTIQTITVTVRDLITGDDETLTLTETGVNSGLFVNGGVTTPVATDPDEESIDEILLSNDTVAETWTLTYNGSTWDVVGSVSGAQGAATGGTEFVSSNGDVTFTIIEGSVASGDTLVFNTYAADPLTSSSAATGIDGNGNLETLANNTINTFYTYDSTEISDSAIMLGSGVPVIVFTRADGTPADEYFLAAAAADGDKIFVTVYHDAANTDTGAQETILVGLTGNDWQYDFLLTETGVDTGEFRNVTGLDAQITDGTPTADDSLWEDLGGEIITATYTYSSPDDVSTTATFTTVGDGEVFFRNWGDTADVEAYYADDYFYVKVTDDNYGATDAVDSLTVTLSSETTGDSEVIWLYETGIATYLFINRLDDLVTDGSDTVTSATVDFVTMGVEVGDAFIIHTGASAGTYTVGSITDLNTIVLSGSPSLAAASGQSFTVNAQIAVTCNACTPASGDEQLDAVTEETLKVTYIDYNTGETPDQPGNNTKTDTAIYFVQPTIVGLAGFNIYSEGGHVIVEWETAYEARTVGFYLFRRDEKSGQFKRVNKKLLPALLGVRQGGVYRYVDDGVKAGDTCVYKLVEVEVNGTKRTYGPFGGTAQETGESFSAGGLELAGYSRQPRAPSPARVARSAARKEAGDAARARRRRRVGHELKIAVSETGMYYLETAEIAPALALPERAVANMIRNGLLQLSCRGEDVAYTDRGSGLVFYGEAIDSIYTDENIYWLRMGKGKEKGLLMELIEGDGPDEPASGWETYTETVRIEEDLFGAPDLLEDPEAEYWFWFYVHSGSSHCYPEWGGICDTFSDDFTLDHVAGDNPGQGPVMASVVVWLRGALDGLSETDHRAVVSLNGAQIGEIFLEGMSGDPHSLDFLQDLLLEGNNTITVTGEPWLNGDSFFWVDSFDLSYERYYEARDNSLLAGTGGHDVVSIAGFTAPDILVFDVTEPRDTKLIAATDIDWTGESWRVSFETDGPDALYAAVAPGGYLAPVSVTADGPSTLRWKGNAADYIIVAPEELKEAAGWLASYRGGRGYVAMVVDLEDIYDEFNDGIEKPLAIRDFLSYAYHNWKIPPRYVVLAGEGTFDYKDVLATGQSLVPVVMVPTPYGLYASDTQFVDVLGDDGVPEMAIGRLPVVTAQELRGVIEKTIRYENAVVDPEVVNPEDDWTRRVIMAADDHDGGGNFPRDSDDLIELLPQEPPEDAYYPVKIYLPLKASYEDGAVARQALISNMNSGALLLNYIGHGGYSYLSDQIMLLSGDPGLMTNGERLPVFLAMTCVAGDFASPLMDCLSEELVLAPLGEGSEPPGGGAVAAWAPTGLSLNDHAKILSMGFFDVVFGGGERVLGDAVIAAMEYYAGGEEPPLPYMLDIYNILGDPALEMK